MKYTITLNQKAVFENNLEGEIDFIDLIIISLIKHLTSLSTTKIIKDGDENYYWISYNHISSELPLLNLKKDSIYRKLKKYVELGILNPHPSNINSKKSYFKLLPKFDLFYTNDTEKNPTYLGKKSVLTSEKNPNPIYIDEHSTNNMLPSTEERRVKFIETVRPYLKEYGQDMCDSFVDYWTEPTRDGKKMLFELKPTWSISGRLATWFKNSQNKRK